jgi:hypothetical protein
MLKIKQIFLLGTLPFFIFFCISSQIKIIIIIIIIIPCKTFIFVLFIFNSIWRSQSVNKLKCIIKLSLTMVLTTKKEKKIIINFPKNQKKESKNNDFWQKLKIYKPHKMLEQKKTASFLIHRFRIHCGHGQPTLNNNVNCVWRRRNMKKIYIMKM